MYISQVTPSSGQLLVALKRATLRPVDEPVRSGQGGREAARPTRLAGRGKPGRKPPYAAFGPNGRGVDCTSMSRRADLSHSSSGMRAEVHGTMIHKGAASQFRAMISVDCLGPPRLHFIPFIRVATPSTV